MYVCEKCGSKTFYQEYSERVRGYAFYVIDDDGDEGIVEHCEEDSVDYHRLGDELCSECESVVGKVGMKGIVSEEEYVTRQNAIAIMKGVKNVDKCNE